MTNRTDSRVLVVDDDAQVRQLIQRALARQRIACDTAADGVEATELHAKRRYDVILCDLRMPRKHGHRFVVEQLSQPNPPAIIAITGVIDPKIITDLFERGVSDIFAKPLHFDLLALKVKSVLANIDLGRPAASPAQNVAQQIDRTTAALRQQLAEVQESFVETIDQLESRRDELEAGYLDSVRVLTGLMEQFGKFEGSHAVRVEHLAVGLGKASGLGRQDLHALKTAALLHEIGQVGMPDKIRTKAPWELDAEEMAAFQEYPIIGAALLGEIHGVESVVEAICDHTENYDGTGFPKGKRAHEISLAGRILRLADGVDTYLMHSVTGDAYPVARAHLLTLQGKHYDPDLVQDALVCLEEAVAEEHRAGEKSVSVSALVVGAVLAENVYDHHGRFLARKGAVITRPLLSCLNRLIGTKAVQVYSESLVASMQQAAPEDPSTSA